ncbi:MAG TPA: hypothetical protein VN714_27205 [Trebonia sp.]|nr:hypothetical protein [Trebonia sp.]
MADREKGSFGNDMAHGDFINHAARVAARGDHARVGGEGQPVAAGPAPAR